jgi:hypothetical protein
VTTFLCVASETSSAKPEILGALSAAFPLGLLGRATRGTAWLLGIGVDDR